MKKKSIRLSTDGIWYDNEIEITHKRTVDLFFKSVYEKQGAYFLKGEKKPVPIVVDDVAYFVRVLDRIKGEFIIKLSDKTKETLDISTLDVGSQNQLYCQVKNNVSKARFERKVYYQLMKYLDERDGYYGLLLDGVFFPVQSKARDIEYKNQSKNKVDLPKKVIVKPSKKTLLKTKNKKSIKVKKSPQKVKQNKKTVSKKPVVKKPVKKKVVKKNVVKKKAVKKKNVVRKKTTRSRRR